MGLVSVGQTVLIFDGLNGPFVGFVTGISLPDEINQVVSAAYILPAATDETAAVLKYSAGIANSDTPTEERITYQAIPSTGNGGGTANTVPLLIPPGCVVTSDGRVKFSDAPADTGTTLPAAASGAKTVIGPDGRVKKSA
jgi:hypothetical protein